jgi:hypothetical protein
MSGRREENNGTRRYGELLELVIHTVCSWVVFSRHSGCKVPFPPE